MCAAVVALVALSYYQFTVVYAPQAKQKTSSSSQSPSKDTKRGFNEGPSQKAVKNTVDSHLCDCYTDASAVCWAMYNSIVGNDLAPPFEEIWTAPDPPSSDTDGSSIISEISEEEEQKEPITVGLFMLYTDDIANYTVHAATMNAAYAARHKYRFMMSRAKLTQPPPNDGPIGRDRQWDHAVTKLPQSKMKYMLDALTKLPEQSGWLLWLDSDLVILRQDVPIQEILASHDVDPETNVLVSLEFTDAVAEYEDNQSGSSNGATARPKGVNTGALLLRNCAWTRDMLRAWHGVGYATGEAWTNDPAHLTPWGQGFLEQVKKMPPDQQMHTELQRPETLRSSDGTKLEYLKHAKVLPTTVLNSRWPYWALDAYDEPLDSNAKPAELQFALHMFASTSEERIAVLGNLHRRALCPQNMLSSATPSATTAKSSDLADVRFSVPSGGRAGGIKDIQPLWQLPPLTLSASLAADGMAALAARALKSPSKSFAHAELCAAVYTLAQGANGASADTSSPSATANANGYAEVEPSSALPKPYHPLYGLSERHQGCLEPGMSSQVARGHVVRKNVDTAYFAYDAAVTVAQNFLLTQPSPPLGSDGQGDSQIVAHLKKGLAEWVAQRDGLAEFRRGARTFLAEHPAPNHVAALTVQMSRQASRGQSPQLDRRKTRH